MERKEDLAIIRQRGTRKERSVARLLTRQAAAASDSGPAGQDAGDRKAEPGTDRAQFNSRRSLADRLPPRLRAIFRNSVKAGVDLRVLVALSVAFVAELTSLTAKAGVAAAAPDATDEERRLYERLMRRWTDVIELTRKLAVSAAELEPPAADRRITFELVGDDNPDELSVAIKAALADGSLRRGRDGADDDGAGLVQ